MMMMMMMVVVVVVPTHDTSIVVVSDRTIYTIISGYTIIKLRDRG